jgi:hypothetical protein
VLRRFWELLAREEFGEHDAQGVYVTLMCVDSLEALRCHVAQRAKEERTSLCLTAMEISLCNAKI